MVVDMVVDMVVAMVVDMVVDMMVDDISGKLLQMFEGNLARKSIVGMDVVEFVVVLVDTHVVDKIVMGTHVVDPIVVEIFER